MIVISGAEIHDCSQAASYPCPPCRCSHLSHLPSTQQRRPLCDLWISGYPFLDVDAALTLPPKPSSGQERERIGVCKEEGMYFSINMGRPRRIS